MTRQNYVVHTTLRVKYISILKKEEKCYEDYTRQGSHGAELECRRGTSPGETLLTSNPKAIHTGRQTRLKANMQKSKILILRPSYVELHKMHFF